MKTKFYIEFKHDNSDAENYDMQSKWFDTREDALDWFNDSFDFIESDMKVFLMTAEFSEDESEYDIVKSERLRGR